MEFYKEIYKLKNTLRKGWIIDNIASKEGRVESDAEHCHSMALLALEIMERANLQLDKGKVLEMVLFHELCEIDYGDHTPYDKISAQEKYNGERACIERLAVQYKMPRILQLWQEFEDKTSPEGQFVKKIDKLDAVLQSKVYAEENNRPEVFEEFKNAYIEIWEEFEKYLK